MYYAYIDWITVDNVTHFIYAGSGTLGRVRIWKRNQKHQGLWQKYNGQRAIVREFETRNDALRYEKMLVAKYGTYMWSMWANEYACNFTDDGDATTKGQIGPALGRKHSIESRVKISNSKKGKKGKPPWNTGTKGLVWNSGKKTGIPSPNRLTLQEVQND